MDEPTFRSITAENGEGVTYHCGCPCTPTAVPAADGKAGFEHCCCGKVHFAGSDAGKALESYLAERKATRKREPDYRRGSALIHLAAGATAVAWAFPIESSSGN